MVSNSCMTHGEEEAQTKEEKKEKSRVPLHDTSGCTFFWFFYILGRGKRRLHYGIERSILLVMNSCSNLICKICIKL